MVEFYKVLGQFKGTIDAQDSLGWQDHNRDNFSVRLGSLKQAVLTQENLIKKKLN